MTQHILIVDDDLEILNLLEQFLISYNFTVTKAEDGLDALNLLKENLKPDLVILDVMMKGMDGISLCREIRLNESLKHLPIIMLTACGEDSDRILGLELGADDYMPKPFNLRELLARVRAVLRRLSSQHLTDGKEKNKLPVYKFANWQLDTGTRCLLSPEKTQVSLTAKVYQLLLAFLESPQRVINRDQLMDIVNNRSCDAFDRSIDILVSRLRQKIEDDPKNPTLIKTVRSGGYMLATPIEKL